MNFINLPITSLRFRGITLATSTALIASLSAGCAPESSHKDGPDVLEPSAAGKQDGVGEQRGDCGARGGDCSPVADPFSWGACDGAPLSTSEAIEFIGWPDATLGLYGKAEWGHEFRLRRRVCSPDTDSCTPWSDDGALSYFRDVGSGLVLDSTWPDVYVELSYRDDAPHIDFDPSESPRVHDKVVSPLPEHPATFDVQTGLYYFDSDSPVVLHALVTADCLEMHGSAVQEGTDSHGNTLRWEREVSLVLNR